MKGDHSNTSNDIITELSTPPPPLSVATPTWALLAGAMVGGAVAVGGTALFLRSRGFSVRKNTAAAANEVAASQQQQHHELLKQQQETIQKLWNQSDQKIHSLLSTFRQEVSQGISTTESRLGSKLQSQERHIGERMAQHHTDLNTRLDAVNAARTELSTMTRKMDELQTIFISPGRRGAFGEVQLEAILRDVMHPGSYSFQKTLSNGKRVDCLLHLPAPVGNLAVDSKFPMDAFLELKNRTEAKDNFRDSHSDTDSAKDEDVSAAGVSSQRVDQTNPSVSNTASTSSTSVNNDSSNELQQKNASLERSPPSTTEAQIRKKLETHLRKHIRDIAQKYILPGETADSAILFLPSESIFAQVVTEHPTILAEANRARVWIACPTTLMAVLTTMQGAVRGMAMTQQAGTIVTEVDAINKDIDRLIKRQDTVERSMETARKNLESMRVSIDKIQRRKRKLDAFAVDMPPSPSVQESPPFVSEQE